MAPFSGFNITILRRDGLDRILGEAGISMSAMGTVTEKGEIGNRQGRPLIPPPLCCEIYNHIQMSLTFISVTLTIGKIPMENKHIGK